MSQQAKNLIAQARTEGWKRLDLGNCGPNQPTNPSTRTV
jgi:hypothetical protein